MSIAAQPLQSPSGNVSRITDERSNLNDDVLARMSQAVHTAENLEQLLAAGGAVSPAKGKEFLQYRQSSDGAYEGQTPATGLPPRTFNNMSAGSVSSPRVVTIKLLNPTEHLDSSDEEECSFHPRINNNSTKIVQRERGDTTGVINEVLYRDAADRKAKLDEQEKMETMYATQKINASKSSTKSMKIILQKLHKSLSSLIKDVESSENPGEINFEGLGIILHRLGIFQNLEFSSNNGDGEKSSLSINHAKVNTERLAKEISFHENLWRICVLTSINSNFIFSDLVLRVLMTLFEDKTAINDAATLLLEILDAKLASLGMTNEKEKFVYHDVKEEKGLWSMEKLVLEFRKLFNDKTSFMNAYSSGSMLKGKNTVYEERQSVPVGNKPEISKKSAAMDTRHFKETFLKKLNLGEEDVQKHNLTDRNHRLNHYHKYLLDSKSAKLAAKADKEVAECSFSPRIKNYKNFKLDTTTMSGSLSPRKTDYFSQAYTSSKVPDRHLLLFESAKAYKEKLYQKSYTTQSKIDADDELNSTFKPKINGTNSQKFLEKPNGFNKTVDRIFKAGEDRDAKKVEAETIPRGENYHKNRAAEFSPPKFINRQKVKAPEVLVYVDVSIGAGKTGRIGIHKGDDPKTLARNFARTYSLNATMRESLEKLLQSYVTSYFEKAQQAESAAADVTTSKDQTTKTEEEEEENN